LHAAALRECAELRSQLGSRIVGAAGAKEVLVGGLTCNLTRRRARTAGSQDPDDDADDQDDRDDGSDERSAEREAEADDDSRDEADDDEGGHALSVPPRAGPQTGDS
jgi:hypothetical protein